MSAQRMPLLQPTQAGGGAGQRLQASELHPSTAPQLHIALHTSNETQRPDPYLLHQHDPQHTHRLLPARASGVLL